MERKRYYVCVFDTETNELRVTPNAPKGRETAKQFVNENTKVYRVAGATMEKVVETFKAEVCDVAEYVPIKYPKNIPTVIEMTLD